MDRERREGLEKTSAVPWFGVTIFKQLVCSRPERNLGPWTPQRALQHRFRPERYACYSCCTTDLSPASRKTSSQRVHQTVTLLHDAVTLVRFPSFQRSLKSSPSALRFPTWRSLGSYTCGYQKQSYSYNPQQPYLHLL